MTPVGHTEGPDKLGDVAHISWKCAFDTFPDPADAFKAGELAARIQHLFATNEPGKTRAEVHDVLNMADDGEPCAAALPEYGDWLPDVWDAYLRELVGWEDRRNWANLPATFRWHELHERLSKAIVAKATGGAS